MSAKPYNGHESWNAWNVSLWIGNDEALYELALDCLKASKSGRMGAARRFTARVGAKRTPDGARYSVHSVYLALDGLT